MTGHEGCVSCLVRWFVNFIVEFGGEVKVAVLYNYLYICLMNIQVSCKVLDIFGRIGKLFCLQAFFAIAQFSNVLRRFSR